MSQERYTTVAVTFTRRGLGRTTPYYYLAPTGWGLRAGDHVVEEHMTSAYGVVQQVGAQPPVWLLGSGLTVLDEVLPRTRQVTVDVPYGYDVRVVPCERR